MAVALQKFNVSCGKLLFINQTKTQTQNFDVQLNLLLVNKALLVVLTMSLALLQRGKTLSFVFNLLNSINYFGSNVGKSRIEKTLQRCFRC